MKFNKNKKYTTIAIYSAMVLCVCILFFTIVWRITSFRTWVSHTLAIFHPFLIGWVIAYLLNFGVKFYENKVFHRQGRVLTNHRLKRGLAVASTYLTVILVLYLFISFIYPQLSESITNFINDFPNYVSQLNSFLNEQLGRLNIDDRHLETINERVMELVDKYMRVLTNFFGIAVKNVVRIASGIWNMVLGTIISIYYLLDKERFCAGAKKMVFAFFKGKHATIIIALSRRADAIFGRFLVGTLIDSFIVAVLTLIALIIFRIPYASIIAFMIGVSNIIPFFGPFLGAIPSMLILFFVSPPKALLFGIIILIIQQIDGNIIAPKILGESIGISAFWVLFSTLVFGSLFGIPGMVLGVPIFAWGHSIFKDIIEGCLEKKSLPVETEKYIKDVEKNMP